MIAYKTYEEAKITSSVDQFMSLSDFFDKGHKLVEGDVYIEVLGGVACVVTVGASEKNENVRDSLENHRYVLKAAALEPVSDEVEKSDDKLIKGYDRLVMNLNNAGVPASDGKEEYSLWDRVLYFANNRSNEEVHKLEMTIQDLVFKIDAYEKKTSADKPELPQWNGEGFPPAGVEFEYKIAFTNEWFKGVTTYQPSSGDFIVALCSNEVGSFSSEYALYKSNTEFRPIETPEQKAARERDEAVREMSIVAYGMPVKKDGYIMSSELYKLYDAGYRKSDK